MRFQGRPSMLGILLGLIVSSNPSLSDDFETIRAEYEAKLQAVERAYLGESPGKIDESKVDWTARYREWPGWFFAPRMMAYAEAHPDKPDAASALFWVAELVGNVGDRDRELVPHVARALELLARSHIDDPRVDSLCRTLAFSGSSSRSLGYLRQVAEKAKDRGVRGRAMLAVARGLTSRASVARDPFFDRPGTAPHVAAMIERMSDSYIKEVRSADPLALEREAELLYERIIKEFGDVPADSRNPQLRTIAKASEAELYKLRSLNIGRIAPDIVGRDVDDKPFKLSDYRGKVVVLTFSGNWCGPCVGMYPGERKLVETHKDKPFAILSVNTDEDRETLKKSIKAGEITWRCWWDGPDRPICEAWAIRSFPTVYLLDAKGIIRKKDLRGEQLDAAVEDLLKETTKETAP
jgi:thiol-disulfide isomerase/thioredoxin